MRVISIKLSFLFLTLVLNNNYKLKKTKKHTCHLKTIQKQMNGRCARKSETFSFPILI